MPVKVITCTMRKTHPRAVVCSMCGGQFFPESLKFHQKSCSEKQKYVMLPCPVCDKEISKLELSNHVDLCRRSLNKKINENDRKAEINQEIEEVCENLVDEEGRMKCSVCNRKFAQDRIATHQKICRKTNEKKRDVFNSFKQRQFDSLIQPTEVTYKKLNIKCGNKVEELKEEFKGLTKCGINSKQNTDKTMNEIKERGKEENLGAFRGTKKNDKKQNTNKTVDVSTGGKTRFASQSKNELFENKNNEKKNNLSYSSYRNKSKDGAILTTNECSADNTLAFPFEGNKNYTSYPYEPNNVTYYEEPVQSNFRRKENTPTFDSKKILQTNDTSYNNPMCDRSMHGWHR